MPDERRDYAILISLYMREEAEVMASALRSEGIDAFVGNSQHAYFNWHLIIALGGLQVMVPRARLQDAREAITQRIADARAFYAEGPEVARVERRDRYKVWLLIAYTLGFSGYVYLENSREQTPVYELRVGRGETFFAAPDELTVEEQEAVVLDYCLDNPSRRVIAPGSGYEEIIACGDVLVRN